MEFNSYFTACVSLLYIKCHSISMPAAYAVVVKYMLLLQVSRLLWDLLGDVSQPFYYGPLGLDHSISTRRALKVSVPGNYKDFKHQSISTSLERDCCTLKKKSQEPRKKNTWNKDGDISDHAASSCFLLYSVYGYDSALERNA